MNDKISNDKQIEKNAEVLKIIFFKPINSI